MGKEALSITRRLDNTLNSLQDEFNGFSFTKYFRDEFYAAIEELKKAEGFSDYTSKLKDLFKMFDACGISYETGRDSEYYLRLVDNADLADFSSVEDKMIHALYSTYENYPSPEEYMRRIVDRLCDPDDHWENDTLRLRILKQFIKYGDYLSGAISTNVNRRGDIIRKRPGGKRYIENYLTKKGCPSATTEDVLENIDDGVFDVLLHEDTTKEQKKFYGKYGILKIADDLANGKFRVWGVTKRDLYLFAMVYGMTYYSGTEESTVFADKTTDIGINLFRDYYSNNFIRFISDTYKGHLQEFELDPSGQGINYKNYAEMIYLYYISKNIPVLEKISRSHEMIDRIRREMRGKGSLAPANKNGKTERLRAYFVKPVKGPMHSEDILSLPEYEFEEFLKVNYLCDVSTPAGDINPMQLESDHKTAFKEYRRIINKIQEQGIDLNDCNYGLWFAADVSGEKALNEAKQRLINVDDKKFDDLSVLLLGIHDYLQDGDIFKVQSGKNVTRSLVIAAYYYYFIDIRMSEAAKSKGFADVFTDFQLGVNKYLDKAHYQLFSGRNIYDVLLAFSAYAYIYS